MTSPGRLQWSLVCSNPGAAFDCFFHTREEVLGYCGRLLYGNLIFEFTDISIRYLSPEGDKDPQKMPDFPERQSGFNWAVSVYWESGESLIRQLKHKHEVMGALIGAMERRPLAISITNFGNPDSN